MARLVKGLVEEVLDIHNDLLVLADTNFLGHHKVLFNRAVRHAASESVVVGDTVDAIGQVSIHGCSMRYLVAVVKLNYFRLGTLTPCCTQTERRI